MSQSARLRSQLEKVRELSEGFLQSFETPEQWTHQVDPSANHALWFAGHMGIADNFFLSTVEPDRGQEAAAMDAEERRGREQERQRWRAMKAKVAEMEHEMRNHEARCKTAVAQELEAAGYYNHRGEWRKRHG